MGEQEQRSREDRREKTERRVFNDPNYNGPERRRMSDRRSDNDRRIKSAK